MRVYCNELRFHVGKTVLMKGWVHRVRRLGAISFFLLRDKTGMVQLVAEKLQLKLETVLQVIGLVVENKRAPGGIEVQLHEYRILSEPKDELPLSVTQAYGSYSLETLLDNRFLSLRNPQLRSILEVQSGIIQAFSRHLVELGFCEIKSSKLISSGTEGGTGLFSVDYFNKTVFLSQSPQFYKQAAVSTGLEKVFEIGPAYRAEKHDTNRHLNEYVSLDVEMAFIEEVDELIQAGRGLMNAIIHFLRNHYSDQLALWFTKNEIVRNTLLKNGNSNKVRSLDHSSASGRQDNEQTVNDPVHLEQLDFDKAPVIRYDEALEIVSSRIKQHVRDLDAGSEKVLSEWALAEHGIAAVFVCSFPRSKRPFYTMPDGPARTKSFDLIFNGVEISSGAVRINDYDLLRESAERFSMNMHSLEDYFSIFLYGCPPHGGFALGLERLTQKLLGIDTVKIASMVPRDRNRVRP